MVCFAHLKMASPESQAFGCPESFGRGCRAARPCCGEQGRGAGWGRGPGVAAASPRPEIPGETAASGEALRTAVRASKHKQTKTQRRQEQRQRDATKQRGIGARGGRYSPARGVASRGCSDPAACPSPPSPTLPPLPAPPTPARALLRLPTTAVSARCTQQHRHVQLAVLRSARTAPGVGTS